MASIDEIIKREVNPFDKINLRPGNFWGEKQDFNSTVNSIHQDAIATIENLLDLVSQDHTSRTVILTGDTGSGKSYLLGRLKHSLNTKAFFAYIGAWPDSDYIWRHTLRYTVDSLIHAPEGQQESQLILWLKSLAAFKQLSMKQLIFSEEIWNLLSSDKQKFVKKLKQTYKQAAIYNADVFFSVLYSLTNAELYPLACEWLRGDDLSEESLKELKVKSCIDSEDAAKNILANFGKIANATQPIVLCFDNLDNIPRLPNGFQDLQALFNINTTIHNDYLKNFLVIISLLTDNWRRNADRIQQSDKARIDEKIQLRSINLNQAEALWAHRLKSLHSQADTQPDPPLFPLTRQALETKFPGGKTDPRNTLILGRELFQKYKDNLGKTENAIETLTQSQTKSNIEAELQLIWQDEYKKVQAKITKISLLPAPELIKMLQEALVALKIEEVKPKLLTGTSAGYSLSYQHPEQKEVVGVVWTEDASMASFCNVMKACQKAINNNFCQNLYLLRAGDVGKPNLAGNQIYRQIFTGTHHRHIKPILSSVHYLAAYHNLVNAALANELVIAGKTIHIKELEALIRESKILHSCTILQKLGIVSSQEINPIMINGKTDLQSVKEFLLNLVKTQNFLGKSILVQNTLSAFPQINQFQVEQLIQQLCHTKQIQIVNPKDKPEKQLISIVN